MKPRVILRPAALADMENIAVWIGRDSPASSARFLEQCLAEFERLKEMPHLGRARRFLTDRSAGIRSWMIKGFPNHIIFYRPVDVGVEILHVLHAAQDIEAIFGESPE